jgi:hypothetical protein
MGQRRIDAEARLQLLELAQEWRSVAAWARALSTSQDALWDRDAEETLTRCAEELEQLTAYLE